MITMMMIMIKQRLWKEIQVYEQPEVRCSSAYLHHLYKTMFFILLSKPSGTIFIRNPNVLMVYCRSRLLRLLFIIGNHWMQSPLLGGGGGIVQRLEIDIRHDEETDVFQGAWWQAISTPGSTSAIDVCRLQIWHDTIRTASTCKRNNFWNYKEKCDSCKDPLSQGMGSSRESYRRRSRDGREG